MQQSTILLKSFLGRWTLNRKIEDEAAGRSGEFVGEAVFQRSGDGLLYEERGTLHLDGVPPLVAERRYLWRQGAGNRIEVCFDDGRPFHAINLDQTMPFDTHFCTPDVYDLVYDLRKFPSWGCRVRVEGPKKTYRLTSLYEFVAPLDSPG